MPESDKLMSIMHGLAKHQMSFGDRVRYTWARIKRWGRKARGPQQVAAILAKPKAQPMTREEIAAMWDREVGG